MLLHAIAHIELNAVDLALDMASHFTKTQLPVDFYHDWLDVADKKVAFSDVKLPASQFARGL